MTNQSNRTKNQTKLMRETCAPLSF